jgi:hypothetical protein
LGGPDGPETRELLLELIEEGMNENAPGATLIVKDSNKNEIVCCH